MFHVIHHQEDGVGGGGGGVRARIRLAFEGDMLKI